MKAKYTKPVLMMESFTLSQTIAHNCGEGLDWSQATTKYKSTCGWATGFPGDTYFIDGNNVCNVDGSQLTTICYNNPDGDLAIFNS